MFSGNSNEIPPKMLAVLSKNKKRIVTKMCIILQYLWHFDTNTDEKRNVNPSLAQWQSETTMELVKSGGPYVRRFSLCSRTTPYDKRHKTATARKTWY
jgi:glutaredoxin 2